MYAKVEKNRGELRVTSKTDNQKSKGREWGMPAGKRDSPVGKDGPARLKGKSRIGGTCRGGGGGRGPGKKREEGESELCYNHLRYWGTLKGTGQRACRDKEKTDLARKLTITYP